MAKDSVNASRLCLISLGLVACGGQQPAPGVVEIESPAAAASGEPRLARTADDTVVLSWLEKRGDGATALLFSTLDDDHWRVPATVATGRDWFVNWADFPSVTPMAGELWAAHWLVKRPGGTYAYDIAISLSHDAGASWSQALTPHRDGTATEHGFVSLFSAPPGVGAVWLDGRNTQPDNDADHAGQPGGMTLRAAVISPQGELDKEVVIDGFICDCCQTDVALGDSGPVVVYRDRSADETRDIYVARLADNQWQQGSAVAIDNWEIAGCPVNGPAIAAAGKEIAVAWFTAARNNPVVRFARSTDAGLTFPLLVDIGTDNPVGRVDVVLLSDSTAVVSWIRKRSRNNGELVVRSIAPGGALGLPRVVSRLGVSRSTGFPQMQTVGDDLLLAWTDTAVKPPRVRTVLVERMPE